MSSLLPFLRLAPTALRSATRGISTSSTCSVWKISERKENDTTIVEMEEVKQEAGPAHALSNNDLCSLCTCNVPVKLAYSDILILEQFMREDGTVLPRQLTGLCKKQQLRVERCVMQAHWAGLFPDRTIPEFDRAGYKRFNRYWKDDMDMYNLKEKKEHGTWFYIKRYPTKNKPVNKRKVL